MKEYSVIKTVKILCLQEPGDVPDFQEENQYEILGLLCMHRCAGIAYYNLWKKGGLVYLNREMRTTLQSIYESNLRKSLAMEKALNYLAELLEGVSFPYALLKGAKLLEIYPKGTRTSNDIDILIEREHIPVITELLLQNGFCQGYIRNNVFQKADRKDIVNALLNRGETTPFVKEVDWDSMQYLEIDVNISVDETSHQKSHVVKQMLQNIVPQIHTEKSLLFTLDPADFLIHLCTHLYKEASIYQWVERGRDLSLYKFLDIYVFWKHCVQEEHIYLLKKRAEKYGVCEAVYYTLYHASQLWDFQDDRMDILLKEMSEVNKDMLDTVYDPVSKRLYRYEDEFETRLFDEKHQQNLKLITEVEE